MVLGGPAHAEKIRVGHRGEDHRDFWSGHDSRLQALRGQGHDHVCFPLDKLLRDPLGFGDVAPGIPLDKLDIDAVPQTPVQQSLDEAFPGLIQRGGVGHLKDPESVKLILRCPAA
jgi:hypothetical protein